MAAIEDCCDGGLRLDKPRLGTPTISWAARNASSSFGAVIPTRTIKMLGWMAFTIRFLSPICRMIASTSPFWRDDDTVVTDELNAEVVRSPDVMRGICPARARGEDGDFSREDETFRDGAGRCSERTTFSHASPTSAAWWRRVGTCAGVEYASRTPFGVIMLRQKVSAPLAFEGSLTIPYDFGKL